MSLINKDRFTKEQLTKARVAKALAHPARIVIIEYILLNNQCINSDLVKKINLKTSTLNQHLKLLKIAGLLTVMPTGSKFSYSINEQAWKETIVSFNELFYRPANKKNAEDDN